MRRIETKAQEGRRKRRNQFILGGILIFVMLFSIMGYGFGSKDNSQTNGQEKNYGGFVFEQYSNGYWLATSGELQFLFSYEPSEVESVNVDSNLNLLSSYSGKPLYIQIENEGEEIELYNVMDYFVLRRQYACLSEEGCSNEEYPIKTCSDNVIVFEKSNSSEVVQEENCVYIRGEDFKKEVDAFLFRAMGIN